MIQSDISTINYVGNNSIVVPYPIPYYFIADGDLVVIVKDDAGLEDRQVLDTDYTVTGEDDPNGGNLLMTWAVPTTSSVTISRVVPATQLTSYQEGDAFPAKSHERALDKLTMLVQQALRVTGSDVDLGQAFRLTEASSGINAIAKQNDSTLGIDALGNAVLRTPGEMLSWLGQVSTAWEDTPERLATRGSYEGQLGVQLDNMAIYIAQSTTPGDWIPFLIGTGIVAATDGVPHLLTPPAGDLVGTEQAQTLHNKTLISPSIIAPSGLTKNDVGLSQVDNVADLNKPVSTATGNALALKQDKNEKGISNGYPSLDGAGKIPTAQLPDSVVGASQYQGTWNAATNTPTIPVAAIGNKGWYFSVAVAGTTNINGINSWAVGDQIISNGTVWQKIPNVSAVSSVNTKTGAVVLVKGDILLDQVDNTSDATKNSASVTLTNKTINGANNTLIVRLDADVTNNLPVTRLNSGTGAAPSTWWCGDGTWKQPPGTGDVNGPTGSVDGEVALYSGTTGKLIRRMSGIAGIAKVSATGLLSTTPKIMAIDVDPNMITGQTEKTSDIDSNDSFLIVDQTTGLLRYARGSRVAALPAKYIGGLAVTVNIADAANDIDIAPGECRDDSNSANMELTTTLTKRLDAAWAAGTNQGGRDTGAIANQFWHVYLIRNPTTGVCDALLTIAYATPTMPSGFTQKRRVGSVWRNPSSVFEPFTRIADYVQWNTPVVNHANANVASLNGTTYVNVTSPPGQKISTYIYLACYANNGAEFFGVRSLDPGGQTHYNFVTPAANQQGMLNYFVTADETSRAWFFCAGTAGGTTTFTMSTYGYIDPRRD